MLTTVYFTVKAYSIGSILTFPKVEFEYGTKEHWIECNQVHSSIPASKALHHPLRRQRRKKHFIIEI